MHENDLRFRCCFCGSGIDSNRTDPSIFNIVINLDQPQKKQYSQRFFCHFGCFKKTLAPNVPVYLEYFLDDEQ